MTTVDTNLFGEQITGPIMVGRDVLFSVFKEAICGISASELVSMMYSPYEAIIDYAELCRGKKTGEKISMLFNPHRYETGTNKSKSIIDAFRTDSFLDGLARATLFKSGKYKELLYQVLQLGINGVQYINEFPPHVAQAAYIKYNAKTILDPCAGWGGRMIGAASVGATYHGFEPATKTYNGLCRLGEFLKTFNNGFRFTVERLPFEDAGELGDYDFAFTSPPYYDTEIYSHEATNSCNRYETFNSWCEMFYIPMVQKSLNAAPALVLNLGQRQYPLVDSLRNAGFCVTQIKSLSLSGASGLGRQTSGAEAFYEVRVTEAIRWNE